jgi:hypothetical protein
MSTPVSQSLQSPVVIAGSGRSGTTWVLDCIAQPNGLRTVFEPLHPQAVPRALKFANRYVPPDFVDENLKEFIELIFSGNLQSMWANYRIRPDRIIPSPSTLISPSEVKKLIAQYKKMASNYFYYKKVKSNMLAVKFIRANLMLGWLEKNFDIRTLFVVRHPCAVLASVLKLGKAWDDKALLVYRTDKALINDYLHKYDSFLNGRLTKIESHTAIWCIENMLPLFQKHKSHKIMVSYENLVLNGKIEWQKVVTALGLSQTPSVHYLAQPSQQASREMREKKFDKNQIGKWKEHFSNEDLKKIQNVLDVFEVTTYNAFNAFPLSSIRNNS